MFKNGDRTVTAQRQALLLVLLCGVLFLSGNWILPLVDRDEPRFAEASREMLEQGDWIIPWYNGNYRFDKPPLIYWCHIICYRLIGENEFAARLPSALFGIGTALLIFGFGRRLRNGTTGFNAALMFSTCVQTVVHARLAVADMAMIFFVVGVGWATWELGHRGNDAQPSPYAWPGFVTSMALGFLAKGPVAWLPLAGVLWLAWRRPDRWSLKPLRLWPALLTVLVMIGLWGVPALMLTEGEFFTVGLGKHVINRTFSVMEGHGAKSWIGYVATLPFFFLTFFVSFFPWCVFSMPPLRERLSGKDHDQDADFLLLQAFLFFLVFTISKTKLPHYTLPGFPFIALWLAMAMTRRKCRVKSWAAGMTVFCLGLVLFGFTAARPLFATNKLFHTVAPKLSADMQLGTLDYEEPSVVWEFRKRIDAKLERVDPDDAAEWLRQSPDAILIARHESMQKIFPTPPAGTELVVTTGLNLAKFKPVKLAALIKRSSSRSRDKTVRNR